MSKYNFYVEDVSVEAIFNKLGGVAGAKRLLRDELTLVEVDRPWREEDSVISFSVESNGTTGSQWIIVLESMGYSLSNYAKQVLLSRDFKPTDGMRTEIVVLKGDLFKDGDRSTKKIRTEASRRGFSAPNAEVACIIRLKFTDEEITKMGLWAIVAMHEPINDADGGPSLLGADRYGVGRWLDAYRGRPDSRWSRGSGFAFAVSQVSSQP